MALSQDNLSRLFTPRREISATLSWGISSVSAAIMLLFWCIITYGGMVDTQFCPTPDAVLSALWKVIANGSLFKHAWASLVVINLGFLISSLIAVPLGLLMGSLRVVQSALEPIVNFTRYLPVTSMIPLLILWIGIGIEEKIAVIFIGTFFQQLVMIADVSARVPNELLSAAYTLGATKRRILTRILLPASLPGIMETLRVTMGWAWTYLVVAELVASQKGLGYMSMQAMRGLHADLIFVAILTIGFLGLVTDLLFKWFSAWALPWAGDR